MSEFFRDEAIYRYSVRCDRATAASIRRAAAKAGLSETAFVQAHFDTILQRRRPAKPAAAEASAPADAGQPRGDDTSRACDCGITEWALRLWRVASAICDEGGAFEADTVSLGRFAHVPAGSVTRSLSMLVSRGLAERVSIAAGQRKAVYRLARRES